MRASFLAGYLSRSIRSTDSVRCHPLRPEEARRFFVNNGDSDLVNSVMHYLHKRVAPKAYPSQLCGAIYDGMSVNADWPTLVRTLGVPTEILQSDEYERRYGESDHAWAVVLLHVDSTCKKVVLSADEFEDIGNIETLQEILGKFVGATNSDLIRAPA